MEKERTMRARVTISKAALAGLILVPCILLGAFPARALTIADIVADPEAYQGKSVTVVGEVRQTLPAGSESAFDLRDGASLITVVSRTGAPAAGTRLQVTGKVRFFSEGDEPESNKFPPWLVETERQPAP
jgi:hypothetical protein